MWLTKTLVLAPIFIFVTSVTLFSQNSRARELTDVNLDIPVEDTGDGAKQQAFDRATEQATAQLAEDLMGSERFQRHWPQIKSQVLKNSTRFVLFIKGNAGPDQNGTKHMLVNLKLSPDNLETLLRDQGVLDAGIKVLPLVEIVEAKSKYVWWAYGMDEERPSQAQDLFKKFLAQLAARFKSKNIYVLDPTGTSFRMSVPAAYRAENLRREDQLVFAQYLKADAVISGRIEVRKGASGPAQLSYDLQMWQSRSGRSIGDAERVEPLASEAPKVIFQTAEQSNRQVNEELLRKLTDVLQSGGLNLNLLKVSVNANLNYAQETSFKRQLGTVREIKVVRERLFAPGKVIFEIETSVSPPELAKVIQRTKFQQLAVGIDSVQDDGVVLRLSGSGVSPSVQ